MVEELTIKSELLDNKITIRLTKQEKDLLLKNSRNSKLSISDFIREKLNQEKQSNGFSDKLSKILELQYEALSQLEFISIHVVKEDNVKDE